MLIYTKKMQFGDLSYSGVFCCKSEEGNVKIRNVEDSHHKNWPFENTGEQKKIKNEIKDFVNHCIAEVASHDSEDSFGLSGTAIFSFGGNSNNKNNGSNAGETTDDETSIIYPKKPFKNGQKNKFKYGGAIIVDKEGRRKKKEPKKPPYNKPDDPKPSPKPNPNNKRNYRVSDFKAQIFKNDATQSEYHLFIESDKFITIRNIFFSIPGADAISFIDSINDEFGNTVLRDGKFKDYDNAFENIELQKGINKFIVQTKFNKKVEILIN
jgi:hypothetical protein